MYIICSRNIKNCCETFLKDVQSGQDRRNPVLPFPVMVMNSLWNRQLDSDQKTCLLQHQAHMRSAMKLCQGLPAKAQHSRQKFLSDHGAHGPSKFFVQKQIAYQIAPQLVKSLFMTITRYSSTEFLLSWSIQKFLEGSATVFDVLWLSR